MKVNKNTKPRVIVHLYGGVGNQLFQYVFGEYIRNRYGHSVFYDVSSFGILETYRNYQLDVITKELPIYKTNHFFFSRYNKYIRYALRLAYKSLPGVKYICDYEDVFEERILAESKYSTLYFDGYWHNKKYAEWLYKHIPETFQPIDEVPGVLSEYLTLVNNKEVISLHVRRGDYLKPSNSNLMGACSDGYYQKAVDILKKKHPDSLLLIFSDDTDWVKENLHFEIPTTIVRNDDIKPFWYIYLMSKCAHNIMSNSTFSWWGAFLNDYPEKDVVMPAKWYARDENPQIYYEKWIKI